MALRDQVAAVAEVDILERATGAGCWEAPEEVPAFFGGAARAHAVERISALLGDPA